jgi:hypothetical protein
VEATSRKAREVAHPQLFRLTFQRSIPLYFPRDVAHPPQVSSRWATTARLAIMAVQTRQISADGRFVAFSSLSSNLVPGDTEPAGGFKDIFVRDTCFGVTSGCVPSTVRTSVTNAPNPETQANGISDYPAISGDGHYVVFLSAATNLVPAGTNGRQMVFLAKTGF